MIVKNKTRIKVHALVIKEMNIGDADKLLTLLTKEFGIIKAFSSGSKNIKNKRFSASSLLTYAEFSLIKVNDTYKIHEAEVIKSFFNAGMDICVLSLSQYFCELALNYVPEDSESEEHLRLFLNSLDQIINKNRNLFLIKAITELRLMKMAGYMPNLIACDSCAKYEDDIMYFDIKTGNLYCNDCKNGTNFEKVINRTILDALRHIVYCDFSKLYRFEIPDESLTVLSKITEEYVILNSERSFMTLNFFKNLF